MADDGPEVIYATERELVLGIGDDAIPVTIHAVDSITARAYVGDAICNDYGSSKALKS